MSDDRQTPHRRRRPSAAPIPEEEPLRIIVGNEQDTPDWMVSDTSGAASRRTKTLVSRISLLKRLRYGTCVCNTGRRNAANAFP